MAMEQQQLLLNQEIIHPVPAAFITEDACEGFDWLCVYKRSQKMTWAQKKESASDWEPSATA